MSQRLSGHWRRVDINGGRRSGGPGYSGSRGSVAHTPTCVPRSSSPTPFYRLKLPNLQPPYPQFASLSAPQFAVTSPPVWSASTGLRASASLITYILPDVSLPLLLSLFSLSLCVSFSISLSHSLSLWLRVSLPLSPSGVSLTHRSPATGWRAGRYPTPTYQPG